MALASPRSISVFSYRRHKKKESDITAGWGFNETTRAEGATKRGRTGWDIRRRNPGKGGVSCRDGRRVNDALQEGSHHCERSITPKDVHI